MSEPTERLSAALADRYVIDHELGQGGMATVYLAHDVRHDRNVALKVLRPELAAVIGADRFLAEIKTTANLQHPNILPLFDSGDADGQLFYVMPYVEGESLRDQLTREKQLPIDDAVRIAGEIASALDYAHRHGVIHRDIKPENILLHDGRALVADFGIALAVSSAGGTRMTETGMSLGTPHYMSPEQAMGEREITAKSDVYALGAVLYEMLSGDPPFTGSTAQAIVARVVTERPRPLLPQRHTIPPHVEATVLKALEKLPADRFATAAEFADALSGRATFATTSSAAPAASATAATPPRSRPVLVALGLALVALAAFAAWGWYRARAATRQPTTWQYVSLGDSVSVNLQFPSMAISPDGSRFVFKDDRQNGLLWVKKRGEIDPTPIPGTERASNPVFSPDGQWIAFVADQHLKKVRPSGGGTITIADTVAGGFGGAAWLDDGTIVYSVPSQNALRRINETGGVSTVALSDSGLIGGGIGHPVALPNARGVLFQYCGSGCVTMSIHVLDLETGTQRTLLNDVVQAWYLPNGYLIYLRRDGVVVAAPFDLDRLDIAGEAIPVLENVAVLNGFAPLAWSPSGELVYVRGSGNAGETALVRVGRDGSITPIDTAWHGLFNSFALSPDGRRVAVGVGSGVALNIYVKQLDHGPFTRLTFGNQDRRPAWTPDGRRVTFIRDTTANSYTVYARAADGTGTEERIAALDRPPQEVTWSPDGKWLLVRTDNGARGTGDIVGFRMTGDTAEVPLVASDFTELNPAVSPDGKWLAYTSNESGHNEVYVRPFPNTNDSHWQVSNGGGQNPVWSRAGHDLFFIDPGSGHLMDASVRTTPTFATVSITPLFDTTPFVQSVFGQTFDVTADDRSFLFLDPLRRAERGGAQTLVWADHWFTNLKERLKQ